VNYCSKCKYLGNVRRGSKFGGLDVRVCNHPNNTVEQHSWFEKRYKYKKQPYKLNKNNNCTQYEETPTKIQNY